MDELELLKRDWQRDNVEYPELSYGDIYKMSHAKSSSIVKWLFYICLLEFAFWFLIALGLKGFSFSKKVISLESSTFFIILAILSYAILFYFIYRFYMNYKTISTTDNARRLMKNIIKTRQTVKMYVIVNLVFLVIGTFYGVFYVFEHDPSTQALLDNASANGEVFKFYLGIILSTFIILVITIAILLVFYWLIYGILLKRLNGNYEELKKLEV